MIDHLDVDREDLWEFINERLNIWLEILEKPLKSIYDNSDNNHSIYYFENKVSQCDLAVFCVLRLLRDYLGNDFDPLISERYRILAKHSRNIYNIKTIKTFLKKQNYDKFWLTKDELNEFVYNKLHQSVDDDELPTKKVMKRKVSELFGKDNSLMKFNNTNQILKHILKFLDPNCIILGKLFERWGDKKNTINNHDMRNIDWLKEKFSKDFNKVRITGWDNYIIELYCEGNRVIIIGQAKLNAKNGTFIEESKDTIDYLVELRFKYDKIIQVYMNNKLKTFDKWRRNSASGDNHVDIIRRRSSQQSSKNLHTHAHEEQVVLRKLSHDSVDQKKIDDIKVYI